MGNYNKLLPGNFSANGFSGPQALPGLVTNLDAQQETGYSEGDPMIAMVDQSGTTSWDQVGARPANYRATALNGRAAYSFRDGGSIPTKMRSTDTLTDTGEWMFYLVSTSRLVAYPNSSNILSNGALYTINLKGAGLGTPNIAVGAGNINDNAAGPSQDTPFVLVGAYNGPSSLAYIYLDGVQRASGAAVTGQEIVASPTLGTYSADVSSPWYGYVGHILIYKYFHSDGERQNMVAWLRSYWNF